MGDAFGIAGVAGTAILALPPPTRLVVGLADVLVPV
jgi:hypothetical protein